MEQSQGVGTGLLREVNHQTQRSEEVCSTLTAKKDQEVLVKCASHDTKGKRGG